MRGVVFAPRVLAPAAPKQFGVAAFRATCCGLTFEGATGVAELKAHNKTTEHRGRGVPPKPAWANGKPTRWRVPARRLPTGQALVEFEAAKVVEFELAA